MDNPTIPEPEEETKKMSKFVIGAGIIFLVFLTSLVTLVVAHYCGGGNSQTVAKSPPIPTNAIVVESPTAIRNDSRITNLQAQVTNLQAQVTELQQRQTETPNPDATPATQAVAKTARVTETTAAPKAPAPAPAKLATPAPAKTTIVSAKSSSGGGSGTAISFADGGNIKRVTITADIVRDGQQPATASAKTATSEFAAEMAMRAEKAEENAIRQAALYGVKDYTAQKAREAADEIKKLAAEAAK